MLKKRLTDEAMVCLIGATHPSSVPPSLASNGINQVFRSKKLDQILFSLHQRKKSREHVKSVRLQ